MTDGLTLGAVEAGGTKFRVARFTDQLAVIDEARFATEDPETTLKSVVAFFQGSRPVVALGIGCFGPVDLDERSDSFGSILRTTKPGWSGIDVLGVLTASIGVPTMIDSDVGAAAIAESERGAGVDKRTVCYVTVGTGIGGAVVVDGAVFHGHGHSEIGHVPTERLPGDEFPGACVYHGACMEGMASGSAIGARRSGGDEDPVRFVAGYLAQLVQTMTYTFAPDVMAFGGGVSNAPGLIEEVRRLAASRIGGYSTLPSDVLDMESYVVRSALDQDAGLVGAAMLAKRVAPI